MTNALVLGCGSIGSRHARNLVHLGVDVTVSDADVPAALRLATELKVGMAHREDAAGYDLIVVATPTSRHVADLAWALEHGANVFVEKPLACSAVDLDEARELGVRYAQRAVMVGCNLRFTEGFTVLASNLGAIGRPAAFLIDYGWWLPSWRPGRDYRTSYSSQRALGGGILLDAIHEIDYVLELAGPAINVASSVTCTGVLEVDVEDMADIVITHKGGASSHIHLDYLRRRRSRSCTVIGTRGELTWDVPRKVVELLTEPGEEPVLLAAGIDADPNAQYVAEMEHMLAATYNGSPTCNAIPRAAAAVQVALDARDGTRP
jgi:predicted dehydrogenase